MSQLIISASFAVKNRHCIYMMSIALDLRYSESGHLA